ncbi:unnamed protein product, partial [Prorocentrum cordatum]
SREVHGCLEPRHVRAGLVRGARAAEPEPLVPGRRPVAGAGREPAEGVPAQHGQLRPQRQPAEQRRAAGARRVHRHQHHVPEPLGEQLRPGRRGRGGVDAAARAARAEGVGPVAQPPARRGGGQGLRQDARGQPQAARAEAVRHAHR